MLLHKFSKSLLTLAVAIALVNIAPTAHAGNTVTGNHAVVSGGDVNTASGDFSVVAGGEWNSANNNYSTVSGGQGNSASGDSATVGGGDSNSASDVFATVGGGYSNRASRTASTIGGGNDNYASGEYATVAGGYGNSATGKYSMVPGGIANAADGDYSFAAGFGAQAAYNGTFVWSDNSTWYGYTSSGANQFLVRANGGFALNGQPVNPYVAMTVHASANNPGYASIFLVQANSDNGILISSGDASAGASNTANNAAFYVDQDNGTSQTRRLSIDGSGNLAVSAQAYKPGGGAWAASSDGRLKKNVHSLDHALDRLLSLRGVTFEYSHPDRDMHPVGTFTGFVAQEVEPVFPNWIGHDAQGYLTVGPQGFEALAVEAIRQMKVDYEARIAKLEDQLAQQSKLQEATMAELRREIASLAAARSVEATVASTATGR